MFSSKDTVGLFILRINDFKDFVGKYEFTKINIFEIFVKLAKYS